MSLAQQKELESTYLMPTFGRKPVQLVRGSGMEAFDDEGNAYLDFIGGIGVLSLGHCHPKVVAALQWQAETLMHVSNYYYIERRGEVAKMVSDLLNAKVPETERTPWKSFFANSGAEANECAIKLARLHAKRQTGKGASAANLIVTLDGSFHGRTLASLAATAQPAKQEAFQPLPGGFASVPINEVEALETLFAQQGDSICAVMLEPIQGESGVHPCTAEFLQAARRLTQQVGALLICDEVQCGIFRTGEPFGFQNFGITPDVVTIAKGIGDGFPLGMCAARGAIGDTFQPGDHGSTFGGSNLAVAAAYATLSALQEEDIAQNAKKVGAYLREKLASLPGVTEVRGLGLMLAADLDDAHDANAIVLKALDQGLLLNATGPHTLRFLPPLICGEEHADVLIERLRLLL